MVKTNQKVKASLINNKVLWLVGIIVVGVVGLLVFRRVGIYFEKQRFAKAEAYVENIASQIEAKIGPADQKTVDNSCGYASREFGRGPRGCTNRVNMIYVDRNVAKANELMTNASVLFGTELYNFVREGQPALFVNPDLNHRGDQSYSQNIEDINGLRCDAQYLYPIIQDGTDPTKQRFDEVLTISISCTGDAKAEYYPVKN